MASVKTSCKRGHHYARWGYSYTSPNGLTANRCRLCRNLSKRQAYRKRVLSRPAAPASIAAWEETRP